MADPQPVHELSREVANMVARAEGGRIEESEIREELGLGSDDLRAILTQLSEEGIASEVAPRVWSQPEAEEPERVTIRTPEPEEEELEDGPISERELMRGLARAADPTVRLTVAIADALDAEALGKLVKAGIGDTPDDDVFVLEVVP